MRLFRYRPVRRATIHLLLDIWWHTDNEWVRQLAHRLDKRWNMGLLEEQGG